MCPASIPPSNFQNIHQQSLSIAKTFSWFDVDLVPWSVVHSSHVDPGTRIASVRLCVGLQAWYKFYHVDAVLVFRIPSNHSPYSLHHLPQQWDKNGGTRTTPPETVRFVPPKQWNRKPCGFWRVHLGARLQRFYLRNKLSPISSFSDIYWPALYCVNDAFIEWSTQNECNGDVGDSSVLLQRVWYEWLGQTVW